MNKLTLSDSLKINYNLSFIAFFAFLLLGLVFGTLEGTVLYLSIKYKKLSEIGSLWAGVAGLCLSATGIWFCLRRRRLFLEFGCWQESPPDEHQERRAMVSGARYAFMEGDFEKAQRFLARYLDQRPGDNSARMNLVCSLVMLGRLEEAVPLLSLAGDPRRQLSRIKPLKGWEIFLARTRSFTESQIASSRKTGVLAAMLLALILPQAWLLTKNGENLYEGTIVTVLPFLGEDMKEVVTEGLRETYDVNGLVEADFKRLETESFIFFYHDEALLKKSRAIAEPGLEFDLDFFGLPHNHFNNHKIKIFLCDNQQEYLKRSPFANSWEAGCAVSSRNVFYTYWPTNRNEAAFYPSTVTHELCHIVYYQIIPGIGQDSWLNEGVASYQGFLYLLDSYHVPPSAWLKQNLFKDIAVKPLPFELFLHHRPQELKSEKEVSQFYLQGHSMVFVLLHFYGKDNFLKFLHNFSRTQDMNKALNESYETIHSLDDLHGVWSLFMK